MLKVYAIDGITPVVHPTAYVHPTAQHGDGRPRQGRARAERPRDRLEINGHRSISITHRTVPGHDAVRGSAQRN